MKNKFSKWELEMFKKHPVLFKEHVLDGSKTRMCDGICIPDGWRRIVETLCLELEKLMHENSIEIVATQVKEKLAGLRFYVDVRDPSGKVSDAKITKVKEEVHKIIFSYEIRTEHICQECSRARSNRVDNNGRLMILCPKCSEDILS